MNLNKSTTIYVVQDNSREIQLIEQVGLHPGDEGRSGTDAYGIYSRFRSKIPFEAKSTTKLDGCSTARGLGLHTLLRWEDRHWVIGYGTNFSDGFVFENIYYLSPIAMQPWIQKIRETLQKQSDLTDSAFHLMKTSGNYMIDELETFKKIFEDGNKLNNPKISMKYIKQYGVELFAPYPESLENAIDITPIDKANKNYPFDKFFE